MRQLREFLAVGLSLLMSLLAWPQSSSTSSAAAGLAAGAALGAGGGQNSTSASSAGGSNAPIEMNIMVYGGLKQIALKIARDVESATKTLHEWLPAKSSFDSDAPCHTTVESHVLLQDTASAGQVATYATWNAYQQNLKGFLTGTKTAIDRDIEQINRILANEAEAAARAREQEKQFLEQTPSAKLNQKNNQDKLSELTGEIATRALTPTPPSNTGGGSGSATPLGLTYLSGITAALGATKSGIAYAPSSVSATTQALTTELGKDLCNEGIALYTSTSSMNIQPATDSVIQTVSTIASTNAQIQASIYTSPPDTSPGADKVRVQTLMSDIASRASVANQMVTPFQSWLSSSDGSGNLNLTDVIRGLTLQNAFKDGIPTLQFTIDAGGGNTRTNSFFLLNLFYTPKPSFNGGVVVTYELRNKENAYIAGDTLKALYDYTKWSPKCFLMKSENEVDDTSLGTGRATRPHRVSSPVVCETK